MAFTVYIPGGYQIYDDNDVYRMLTGGHLVVEPANGIEVFTYNNWTYLKADSDHRAGGPKKGGDGGARKAVIG